MRLQGNGEAPASGGGLAEHVPAVVRQLALYPYQLSTAGPDGRPERPKGQSAFSRLAIVQGLSSAGDAMVAVALAGSIFFNVSTRAAESKVALSLALTVAPFAIVGPLLGAMVERGRGSRRALLAGSAAGRAICCFFMAFWVHSLLLFPVAFFTLVFSKLYLVTKAAVVPGTVDRPEQLVTANSKLAVGGSVAGMVSGLIGVGLLDLFGASGLLRCAIVVYLAATVAATRLRNAVSLAQPVRDETSLNEGTAPSGPSVPSGSAEGPGPSAPSVAPPAPALEAPPALGLPPGGLQLAAVATGGLRAATGFVLFLLVFTFRRDSAALIWYGLALGASQVGNVVGALLAPRLRRLGPEEWMLTASSVVVGASALCAGLIDWGREWAVAVALAAGIGLAAASGKLAFDSMVQRDVPSRVRGRSFARFESGFQLAWALGSLIAVLVPMSLSVGFIVIGSVGLLGALAFAGGSVRARRGTLPSWWPGAVPRPKSAATTGPGEKP
jgi:MFS family permease